MKKLLTIFCACLLLSAAANVALAGSLARDTYHNDHRSTPQLQFEPAWDAPGGLAHDGVADAFIQLAGDRYQLPADREDLQLREVKKSLLGSHYIYQQMIDGIPVEGGDFVVSVALRDDRVYRVYNNTYPVTLAPAAPMGIIGEERAYDAAWQELRADGDLLAPAMARLVYVPTGDTFVLQYIVDLELSAPYGGWRLNVDALDGVVLQIEDSRLIRKVTPDMPTLTERLDAQVGPAGDRQAAFARYEAQDNPEDLVQQRGNRAQGTGRVFDPDPRTTLMNNSLQDGSSSSLFTNAYFIRDLQDIALQSGIYRLNGPWVYIANWDPPATSPSTTTTGNWTATRGNNAFNDAMTYFHLDQSQRYIQSLGFTGSHGIQNGSILADSDGVNGGDNSYYQPAYNRLSFGHGCVDDNEDADVILHEYGHAINHDITNWGGGDTGAMGEGFGDYWAGSYSVSTLNGMDFYPNWVYTWDGHGSPTLCWPGRIMNALDAIYVPGTTYGAHQPIPGGYQSDELWSTPLFQTLLTLLDMGYPREDVDQIILESHFGVSYGVNMRGMANATIATAELLQPDGPHADVFIQKFLVHQIVDIPIVQLQAGDVTFTGGSGTNGVADPGETVDFTIEILNFGELAAQGLTGVLGSNTPGVTVVNGNSAFADLPAGGSGSNLTDFTLAIDPNFTCGDPIELTLNFSYNNTLSVSVVDVLMGTGIAQGVTPTASPNVSIPDNNSAGITSTITVSGTGLQVTADFSIDVRITHPNIGDLRVTMTSPVGSTLWLHNRSGGAADNLIGNYPNTLTPISPITQLVGQPLDGNWTIKVVDAATGNTGTLESWGINQIGGYECEDATSPVGDSAMPTRFSVWQNHPNPFNPMTTIEFAVPENAGVVNLAIYDISGRLVRSLESGSLSAGHYSRVWDGRDSAGRSVSSGTYFYRLSGRGFNEARKMILMK